MDYPAGSALGLSGRYSSSSRQLPDNSMMDPGHVRIDLDGDPRADNFHRDDDDEGDYKQHPPRFRSRSLRSALQVIAIVAILLVIVFLIASTINKGESNSG